MAGPRFWGSKCLVYWWKSHLTSRIREYSSPEDATEDHIHLGEVKVVGAAREDRDVSGVQRKVRPLATEPRRHDR